MRASKLFASFNAAFWDKRDASAMATAGETFFFFSSLSPAETGLGVPTELLLLVSVPVSILLFVAVAEVDFEVML